MSTRTAVALALGSLLLAGCSSPAPAPTPAGPGLAASHAESGTLLSSPMLAATDRQAWLDRLEWAAETLAGTSLGPLDDHWDGRLVVELPTGPEQYVSLAGTGSSDAAAVTRCPSEGPRITVNPAVAGESADYLNSLVLHEAVHVATGSSCGGDAPQWVEEGLAEWVASEHSGDSLAANLSWVAEYLRLHGVPEALPDDAQFEGDSDSVSAAYGLARQAVAVAIDRLGVAGAMDYFEDAETASPDEATTAALTQWYREELAGLSGSAQR